MAQQGSSLQNYNNELVKCIEDLKEKREEVPHRRAAGVFACICSLNTRTRAGQPTDREGRGGKGQDTERPAHADGEAARLRSAILVTFREGASVTRQ
jgi:hypothetical protein